MRAEDNVSLIAENGLCTGCGVCASVCPVGAISYRKELSGHVPVISAACIHCKKCLNICPGLGVKWEKNPAPSLEKAILGQALEVSNAYVLEAAVHQMGTSGGVVTCLIDALLRSGAYDAATIVEGVDPQGDMCVKVIERPTAKHGAKSKYLQVSQAPAMDYLKENHERSLIIVGVPCVIRAMRAALAELDIADDRVLFLGLFCDGTLNDICLEYFSLLGSSSISAKLFVAGLVSKISRWRSCMRSLDFRNKAVEGYPGGVRIYLNREKHKDYSRKYRMCIKPYFTTECCLYCLDKLNVEADIVFGDDYTNQGPLNDRGATSVIVRTEKGLCSWNAIQDRIVKKASSLEEMAVAQHISSRRLHTTNARIKASQCSLPYEINTLPHSWDISQRVICEDDEERYKDQIGKLAVGQKFASAPELLFREAGCGFFWRIRRSIRRLMGRFKR